jgi:hypothetical protein
VGFALLVRRRAELQDAGEIAIEHRIQALGVSARNQHHLLDQRVQDLRRLVADQRIVQRRLELLDLPPVELGQVRMRATARAGVAASSWAARRARSPSSSAMRPVSAGL